MDATPAAATSMHARPPGSAQPGAWGGAAMLVTAGSLLAWPIGGFAAWGLLALALLIAWAAVLLDDLRTPRQSPRTIRSAWVLLPAVAILLAHLLADWPTPGRHVLAGGMDLSYALALLLLGLGSVLLGRWLGTSRRRVLLGGVIFLAPMIGLFRADGVSACLANTLLSAAGLMLIIDARPAGRLRLAAAAGLVPVGLIGLLCIFRHACPTWPGVWPGWFGSGERGLGLLSPDAQGAAVLWMLIGPVGLAALLAGLGWLVGRAIRRAGPLRGIAVALAAAAWLASPGLASVGGCIAGMVALAAVPASCTTSQRGRLLSLAILLGVLFIQAIAPLAGLLRWGIHAVGFSDKVEHILAGGMLTLVAIWALPRVGRRGLVVVLVLTALAGVLGELGQAAFSSRRGELADAIAHLLGWGGAVVVWQLACNKKVRTARRSRLMLPVLVGLAMLCWLGLVLHRNLVPEARGRGRLRVSDGVVRPGVDGYYFRGRSDAVGGELNFSYALLVHQPARPLQRVYCSGQTVYPHAIHPEPGLSRLHIFGNPFGPLSQVRYPLRLAVPLPTQPTILYSTTEPPRQIASTPSPILARMLRADRPDLDAIRRQLHRADPNQLCLFDVRNPDDIGKVIRLVNTWLQSRPSHPVRVVTDDALPAQ